MTSNWINIYSSSITAIATIVMAWVGWLNYKMYKEIQKRDEEYKQRTEDLYQALVKATLLTGACGIETAISKFKDIYKGKTKIF